MYVYLSLCMHVGVYVCKYYVQLYEGSDRWKLVI